MAKKIIDTHCHLFNVFFIDNFFVSKGFKKKKYPGFYEMLGSNIDVIYNKLKGSYSVDTEIIIVPLMMDMIYGMKTFGIAIDSFNKQINELEALKNSNKDTVFPFLAVDPRRDDIVNKVKEKVGKDKNFHGIKIYPSLGYLPSNPILMDVFQYCEEEKIPVTTHCALNPATHGKHRNVEVEGINHISGKPIKTIMNFPNANSMSNYFTNPVKWKPVLEKYPNLYLDFAHFGLGDNGLNNLWVSEIKKLLKEYPNTYTDLSYTFTLCQTSSLFVKRIKSMLGDSDYQKKIMYGSDYYMVLRETEYEFKEYFECFKSSFTKAEFDLMTFSNPNKFLFER